jgi:hypothetical protein
MFVGVVKGLMFSVLDKMKMRNNEEKCFYPYAHTHVHCVHCAGINGSIFCETNDSKMPSLEKMFQKTFHMVLFGRKGDNALAGDRKHIILQVFFYKYL